MENKNAKKKSIIVQKGRIDITFLAIVLILLTIGLVMLFSASYAYSLEYYNNSYKFISKQALFAAVGLVVMFVFSRINYHFWQRISVVVFLGTIFILF